MSTTGGWDVRRTVPPSVTPVTVAQAQDWLGVTGDDARLRRMILAATNLAELHMSRAIMTQTWKMTLDEWPGGVVDWWDAWHAVTQSEAGEDVLELPYPPLQSVTSVTTYDVDDTATSITTLTTPSISDYFIVDANAEPGRLVLRSDQAWPADTRIGVMAEIVWVAGYGDDDQDVPEAIKQGIMDMVAWQYEHRGDCDAGGVLEKSGALAWLGPYRIEEV